MSLFNHKFVYLVILVLGPIAALSGCSGRTAESVINEGIHEPFIFYRLIESVAPPVGWRAHFFYCSKSGVVQYGTEIDQSLCVQEWMDNKLWDQLQNVLPEDEMSTVIVPQKRPYLGTDLESGDMINIWSLTSSGKPMGWLGDSSLASISLNEFCSLLEDAFSGSKSISELRPSAEVDYVRSEFLDMKTQKYFSKEDLLVPLPEEKMSEILAVACRNPFRAMPVIKNQNPFRPWRKSVAWGRTALEGWAQSVPVQIKSWKGSNQPITSGGK